jgi:hypothetical protein
MFSWTVPKHRHSTRPTSQRKKRTKPKQNKLFAIKKKKIFIIKSRLRIYNMLDNWFIMRNRHYKLWLWPKSQVNMFLPSVVSVLCSSASSSEPGGGAVSVWTPFEVIFQSDTFYPSPLSWNGSVELDVDFHLSGSDQHFVVPGFWDGGKVWRARFSPPLIGTWQFTSSFTEPRNAGLHNVSG